MSLKIRNLVGVLTVGLALLCAQNIAMANIVPVKTTGLHPEPKQPVIIQQQNAEHIPVPIAEGQLDWPSIVSQSAVVMDMSTGTVVYAKDARTHHYPASVTKILTAMIALHKGQLSDVLTTSVLASKQEPSTLNLAPGEKTPLEKLLYGLLLHSGNDAAVVIAEHYGKSVPGFATMMNQQAAELGASDSHFVNPNGLPDPNHWTTAYDMALISRAAMQIPEFRKIVRTKTYDWNGQNWKTKLINYNHMLFQYPGAIGLKTGYTAEAGQTLVVAATHGKESFLAVLMDAPTNFAIDRDATNLLNFAFAQYRTQEVIHEGAVVGYLTDASGKRHPAMASDEVLATTEMDYPLTFRVATKWNTPKMPDKNGVIGSLWVHVDHNTTAALHIPLRTDTVDGWIAPPKSHWMRHLVVGLFVAGILYFIGRRRRNVLRRKRNVSPQAIAGVRFQNRAK